MKTRYTYTIAYSDVDASRHIRLCDLERYLLEAAGSNAARLGLGTPYLAEKYNTAWVLTRMTIMMDYLPSYNDQIIIETWVEGNVHMLSMRNFRIYLKKDDDQFLIGQCASVWTVLNLTTRQVDTAVFADPAWEGKMDGERLTLPRAHRLGAIEQPSSFIQHTIRYSDLDFNNHCNSVKYLQFMLNACDQLTGKYPVRVDINYVKEVHKGEQTRINVLQDTDKVQYCLLGEDNNISCTCLITTY